MEQKIEVSPDEMTVNLSITGHLTAIELQELMLTLGDARAEMRPSVPADPPTAKDGIGSQGLKLLDDPRLTAELGRNGAVRIWIRDESAGWFLVRLAPNTAAALGDWFAAARAEGKPLSELFGGDGGKGGATAH